MTDKFHSDEALEKGLPSNERPKRKVKKPVRIAIRVLLLIVAFSVVAFGTIFVADLFSSDDAGDKPEVLTVTVLGDSIRPSGGDAMSFSEFETYINELDQSGELDTVALITDTANSPDVELYNRIVALMEKYGIEFEKISSTSDEK